ncbi:ScyD/ScyE family protein [Microbacterium sp. H1-D42]|uniref:ScyD/ScyE family protein n=1 Tax=Microbacterium sp. H1-D42 TaxID=2925844 RepID=UPI001F53267B|nr:ScyD/ScyE family protein [Microbacterium sp. H1-D42]UNK71296.1 ScyD/ScyE family protein [Microbacterium sp. H1-D42]
MRGSRALIAAGAVLALALTTPTVASAASDPPAPQEWSNQVAMPYSLTVDGQRVLVADGALGIIGQLQPNGSIANIITGAEGTTSVATRGKWMAYTTSVETGEEAPPAESGLEIIGPNGPMPYVDLHAYEYANNPDGGNTYGFVDGCLADGGSNPGLLDAHAYTVVSYRGAWLVADAGANVIWHVTNDGDISVFAVLPAVPVTVDAQVMAIMGLPDCALGSTFNAEPVPTGLAVGPGNVVYVSTLPGFPGMVTGAGQLWRIDRSGEPTAIAAGLSGPTSISMAGPDALYVAQLFGGGIAKVSTSGQHLGFTPLPNALAVSTASNGTLWAATAAATDDVGNPTGPGTIVSISKGKVKVNGHILR